MDSMLQVIAHRGASAAAPENTLPAFELAWELGADGVECDVRLTADCQLVCFHDANTKRVSGQSLEVGQHSAADLRQLDVGALKGPAYRGTRIPLLSELLARAPAGKEVFIEVKEGVEVLPTLIEVIEAGALALESITVIAFDLEVVRALKMQRPKLRVLWLIDVRSNWLGRSKLKLDMVLEQVAELSADGLGLRCHSGIHREMVAAICGASLHLNIWTVDDPSDARRYASFGASSISSNVPEQMLAAIRSL